MSAAARVPAFVCVRVPLSLSPVFLLCVCGGRPATLFLLPPPTQPTHPHPPTHSQIRRAGYQEPTPIQAQSWPVALRGSDLISIAKTGSGKTCGFLLPGFSHCAATRKDPRAGPTMCVLAPTRELAVQIKEEADKFGRSGGFRNTCAYGGAPKGPQLRDLRYGVHLVIATPGRLNDFLEAGAVRLHQVSYLVLDEADRMLDMGFEPQIQRIVRQVPPARQTLFFSATWPKEVKSIAAQFVSADAVCVFVGQVRRERKEKVGRGRRVVVFLPPLTPTPPPIIRSRTASSPTRPSRSMWTSSKTRTTKCRACARF